MIKIIYSLILIVFLFSCINIDKKLRYALENSGSNRKELERVLQHYSANKSDSLKLKAAKFLIRNMPGHYTLNSDRLKNYLRLVDSLRFFPGYKQAIELIPCGLSGVWPEPFVKEEDIKYIKSEYLIHQIDLAFRIWNSKPWLANLGFDDFCEYVLPYRIANETLTNWRDSSYRIENKIKSRLEIYDDTKYSSANMARGLFEKIYTNELYEQVITVPDTLIVKYKMGCYDKAQLTMFMYRILGIPAAIDYIPCWASYDGSHYWTKIIDEVVKDNSEILLFNRSIAKVYRRTYSHNEFLYGEEEYVPDFCATPFNRDVTDEYVLTSDIAVDMVNNEEIENGYLAVFHKQKWRAVAHGKKRYDKHIFSKMGRDVVYLPVYFKKQQMKNGNYPFILRKNGQIQMLVADTLYKQNMILNRKYLFESYKEFFGKSLIGTRIEASNDLNFKTSDTIFQFKDNPEMKIVEIMVTNNKKYRYWRLAGGTLKYVSELSFFDNSQKRIEGEVMAEGHWGNVKTAFDNNPVSFVSFTGWLGVGFSKPEQISKIHLLPRNDGNGIFPGNTYELFYMGKDGWVSCGQKVAKDYFISFEAVPSNSLYWLRNLSAGKEERIFTYVDRQVKFW